MSDSTYMGKVFALEITYIFLHFPLMSPWHKYCQELISKFTEWQATTDNDKREGTQVLGLLCDPSGLFSFILDMVWSDYCKFFRLPKMFQGRVFLIKGAEVSDFTA